MKWEKCAAFAGFVLLSFIVLLLAVLSVFETYQHHPYLSAVKMLILIGLAAGIYFEGKSASFDTVFSSFGRPDFFDILGVLAGGVTTFLVQSELGLSSVAASSVVGLLSALLCRKHAAAVFCGSFVGMASPAVFSLFPCIIISSLLSGLIFAASREMFQGVGGKLGTAAFTGCLLTSAVFRYAAPGEAVYGWEIGWIILVYSIAGAVITFHLNHKLQFGPVLASSAVGLVFGIFLPMIHGGADGTMLAVMAFCASFAGMAGLERVSPVKGMAVAGVICGLLFIYTAPYLGGAGGKLGTIAFAAILSVIGWNKIFQGMKKTIFKRGISL